MGEDHKEPLTSKPGDEWTEDIISSRFATNGRPRPTGQNLLVDRIFGYKTMDSNEDSD